MRISEQVVNIDDNSLQQRKHELAALLQVVYAMYLLASLFTGESPAETDAESAETDVSPG